MHGDSANLFTTATEGPEAMSKRRYQALDYWTKRAGELEARERELHDAAHPDLKAALDGQRLLLFGEMLEAFGFPEPGSWLQYRPGAVMGIPGRTRFLETF